MQLVTVQECLTFFFSVAVILYLWISDRAAVGGTAMTPAMPPTPGAEGRGQPGGSQSPDMPENHAVRQDSRAAERCRTC
jgi:hypothetical protein